MKPTVVMSSATGHGNLPLEMDGFSLNSPGTHTSRMADSQPILPGALQMTPDDSFGQLPSDDDDDEDDIDDGASWEAGGDNPYAQQGATSGSPKTKKKEWLMRMNRKLAETPVGELDPTALPLSAVMNAWAKTKSSQGASMVEMWLKRAQQEYDVGNRRVVPTTKMYTMAGTYWLVFLAPFLFEFESSLYSFTLFICS